MQFFKHFVTAHQSNAMIRHMDEWGIAGYGRYFILMELCSEQLEKEKFETVTEAHCHFNFYSERIRKVLRLNSKTFKKYFETLQEVNLLSFELSGDVLKIYVPKLLECLDRDFKRSRKVRSGVAQIPPPEEELELEKEIYTSVEKVSAASIAHAQEIQLAKLGPLSTLKEIISEWGITLKHFGINKTPAMDEVAIGHMVRRFGAEKAKLAIIGQRYEAKTETFNPGSHLSITRMVRKREIFEKLVNLGSQDRTATTQQPKNDYSFLKENA